VIIDEADDEQITVDKKVDGEKRRRKTRWKGPSKKGKLKREGTETGLSARAVA
jgi:hypothetical protein